MRGQVKICGGPGCSTPTESEFCGSSCRAKAWRRRQHDEAARDVAGVASLLSADQLAAALGRQLTTGHLRALLDEVTSIYTPAGVRAGANAGSICAEAAQTGAGAQALRVPSAPEGGG